MSFVTIEGVRVNTEAVVGIETGTSKAWESAYSRWEALEWLRRHENAYNTHAATLREIRERRVSTVPGVEYPEKADYQVTIVSLSDGRKIEVPGKTVEEVEYLIAGPSSTFYHNGSGWTLTSSYNLLPEGEDNGKSTE